MKFYVFDREGNTKIPIKLKANSRREILERYRNGKFLINRKLYSINDIVAEPDENATATGAIIGGVLGAVAGAAGVGVGAAIGGMLGKAQEESSKKDAERFNSELMQ